MLADNTLTYVDLFAGIGGFSVGLERAGWACVGQCEIDANATAILHRHWPDVPKHDDVQTLRPDTFAPPLLVTCGTPCQGLSQAGLRRGMDDPRSGLFLEAVRYVNELKEATNGRYPRYLVWENVKGALSSAKGADFRAVLTALLAAEVPVPRSQKWANTGLARGRDRALVWRVLDAQHYGLAQRRQRVFVVVDLGGGCPGEVLLESEGLPRDPRSSQTARPETTATAGDCARERCINAITSSIQYGADAAHALSQVTHRENRSRVDPSRPMPTIAASGDPCVALYTGDGKTSDPITVSEGRSWTNEGSNNFRLRNVVQDGYRLRRLMPVEGERLFGLADDHTAHGIRNGKVVQFKDKARWRVLGNTVAVPVVHWIGARLRIHHQDGP